MLRPGVISAPIVLSKVLSPHEKRDLGPAVSRSGFCFYKVKVVGAERFELPTLCSQINFPDNKLLLFNRLESPRCSEMYYNV